VFVENDIPEKGWCDVRNRNKLLLMLSVFFSVISSLGVVDIVLVIAVGDDPKLRIEQSILFCKV
jgi:hypothetical protein